MPRILIYNKASKETEELAKVLTAEGYQVDISSSIKETLHEVAFENYQVLIFGMDIDMGTEKGIEAISMINRVDKDLPIITITGQDSLERQRKVRKEKIFYYLVRPIDNNEVVEVVRKALLQRIKKQ